VLDIKFIWIGRSTDVSEAMKEHYFTHVDDLDYFPLAKELSFREDPK
jgi:hypothetical protein